MTYKDTLREAMTAVQEERIREIGGRHTWRDLVETYGEAILFAEIASIVSRLKGMFWQVSEWENLDDPVRVARALDLLTDLGNYAEFLYVTILERARDAERGRTPLDSAEKGER